jgi:uncharacterized protein YyaL (SSP411 family)
MGHDFKNELFNESSPYLLQHAHNPVHWQTWSSTLLERAQSLNKPLLISIGYSSCHWCHVMERESFENQEIAKLMNNHFINIKIDREERPDLDHFFMDALQALTGQGGWPLHIFATPEGLPFFGGTYFPPKRIGQHHSWIEILEFVNNLWLNKQSEVISQANNLMAYLHKKERLFTGQISFPKSEETNNDPLLPLAIADKIMQRSDKENGGFGTSPKFPQLSSLQFLFAFTYYSGLDVYQQHAILTLRKMLFGGIFDHLAGGLSRYSTDSEWLVPHFEKMLYDNAMLIACLCDAYQITKEVFFADMLEKTISCMQKDFKSSRGGYYTAIDADSEGVEGKYYLWSKEEIDNLLGEDALLFCSRYGVSTAGNWEGSNILCIKKDFTTLSTEFNKSELEIQLKIQEAEQKLLSARSARIAPQTDVKIIVSQNAQLLYALSKAAGTFQNSHYLKLADELYEFINSRFVTDNEITHHCLIGDELKHGTCLDDYVYLIQALIKYYEVTANYKTLHQAHALTQKAIALFSVLHSPFFYFSPEAQQDVIQRKTVVYDSPVPSGNAVMCENLLLLAAIFDDSSFQEKASLMVSSMKNWVESDPNSFAMWAILGMTEHYGQVQIFVCGGNASVKMKVINGYYIPSRLLLASETKVDWPASERFTFTESSVFNICKGKNCLFSADIKALVKIIPNFTRI